MFGFGVKPQPTEDGAGTEGIMSSVKIGGQEFQTGDSKAFDAWMAKAKAGNEAIPIGDGSVYAPVNSALGKAELIKAQLQINYGYDEAVATKAVNQLPGANLATKPVFIYKKPPSEDGSQAVITKGTAKANTFRSPRGQVA